jgi:peroxiredoxin
LEYKTIDAASVTNDGKPMVVSFWATWCKPCISELNALSDYYEDLQKTTGVKVVAVSIDDARTSAKVGPFVAGQEWEYTVLLDPNSVLRRAMGVNNVPHTFLLNGKGQIVYQANKYVPGEEKHLMEAIRAAAAMCSNRYRSTGGAEFWPFGPTRGNRRSTGGVARHFSI